MKIYFVRHAKTNANLLNKWQGISDLELSNEGIKELENLKEKIDNFHVDIVYTSPLKRAKQTANIFMKGNTELIVEERLIERDFGMLEQTKVEDYQKEALSNMEENTDLEMNVEKIKDMYSKRVKPFLLELKNKYEKSNKKILIVSHSWVGRLVSFFSLKEKDQSAIKVAPKNAEIYEYDI